MTWNFRAKNLKKKFVISYQKIAIIFCGAGIQKQFCIFFKKKKSNYFVQHFCTKFRHFLPISMRYEDHHFVHF